MTTRKNTKFSFSRWFSAGILFAALFTLNSNSALAECDCAYYLPGQSAEGATQVAAISAWQDKMDSSWSCAKFRGTKPIYATTADWLKGNSKAILAYRATARKCVPKN